MRQVLPWFIGVAGLGVMVVGLTGMMARNQSNGGFLFSLTSFVLGIPMIAFAFSNLRSQKPQN